MTDWQTIDTAPKDGTRVLLSRPTSPYVWATVVIGRWQDDRFAKRPRPFWGHDLDQLEGKASTRENQPTHWMPLPEPPQCK